MTKTLKNIFSVAILMVMALVLVACNGDDGDDGDVVTLTVWGDLDNQVTLEAAFTRINEAFEDQHPNIRIDYQWSGTLESINVAVQSNTLPDLFWTQGNKSTRLAEMANNGFLLALDSSDFDLSEFPQDAIDYAMVDGVMYSSLPSFFSYAMIYYNRDMFTEFNLSVPSTFAEFEALSSALSAQGVTPISIGGAGDFDRYWMMQIMAASLANDTLTQVEEGEAVDAIDWSNLEMVFDFYRDFAMAGYFGQNVEAIDGTGAMLTFTNGNAGMITDGTWNDAAFNDLGFEVGRFVLPGLDGIRLAQSGPSNMNTYSISSATNHPEEAILYLQFLMSDEAQLIFAEEVGQVPMLDSITVDHPAIDEMTSFDDIGKNIFHAFSAVATDDSRPQDLLLTDVLPRLLTGQITGSEAVDILRTEMERR